ncbi:MFS transporter [Arthrobacter sp. 31Y]|uniref:MFS transporter n=1 Tax=Arthrobacter sp. 31Y TaxID=1115632 RepID=UPI000464A197|nr:MFS transporter [Arthrobacter sp. 31Y]
MPQSSSLTETSPALGSPGKLKTAIAAGAGTLVENYDFLAFGTASALYFGAAFFPSADPTMGTLLAFLTFGVGFLARPLGGALGGYFGDKYGRKPVLFTALLVMGAATFLIGLLPTYAQIGILAPIILVVVRLIQGLAYGAEWGGAVMMTFEHAPWKSKGKYSAIPQAGSPAGIALATVAFLASAQLGNDWAWRVPFLASAVLVILGLYVRLRLEESPDFERAKSSGEILKNPVAEVLRKDWRTILRVISLRLVESCGYYVISTFLLSRVTAAHPEAKGSTLIALLIACLIAIPTILAAGAITDRIGRKPLYIIGSLATIVFAFPMFQMTNSGDPLMIIIVFGIGIGLIWSTFAGVQGSWFGELFPTNTRNSGASLGYQLAASIAGFSPFLAGSLAAVFGWVGGSMFYMLIGVIGLTGAVVTRETWGKRERSAIREILDAAETNVVPRPKASTATRSK